VTLVARHENWEDFAVGERFSSAGRTVAESDILTFAGLTGDFYPLHVDAEFARESPFGSRIAHGILTLALSIGQVVLTGVYGESIVALAGVDNVRATAPVRIGDTLRTEVEVLAKRESHRPEQGQVTLNYSVNNQRHESVMTFQMRLVLRRAPGPTGNGTHLPTNTQRHT
jgi:3-hydroxybutyryl-CoA dehydratase